MRTTVDRRRRVQGATGVHLVLLVVFGFVAGAALRSCGSAPPGVALADGIRLCDDGIARRLTESGWADIGSRVVVRGVPYEGAPGRWVLAGHTHLETPFYLDCPTCRALVSGTPSQ